MMVFMLCHMFSLKKSSQNAMVGHHAVCFNLRICSVFRQQIKNKKHGGIIFQGVITELFLHNNGVQIAGKIIIKRQLAYVVAHLNAVMFHIRMQPYLNRSGIQTIVCVTMALKVIKEELFLSTDVLSAPHRSDKSRFRLLRKQTIRNQIKACLASQLNAKMQQEQ